MGIHQLSTFKSNMFQFNFGLSDTSCPVTHLQGNIKIFRQVIDKEVLLGAAAFTVSRERMQVATNNIHFVIHCFQVVNFTVPIDVQPYTFMYRFIFTTYSRKDQITFSVGNIFGISISQAAS